MRLGRLGELARELAATNYAFLSDGSKRARLREVLRLDGSSRRLAPLVKAEEEAAPPAAKVYAGLTDVSLALAGIREEASQPPALNLVVEQLRHGGVFAGVHTAISAGGRLAQLLDRRLRVITLDPLAAVSVEEHATAAVRAAAPDVPFEIVPRGRIGSVSYGRSDVWVATHSKTAHALQVACEAGVLDRERVAYLIQDYEPGFSPWSTDSVLAEATYRAGFLPIVNSTPLWRYLGARGHDVPRELVFAPHFEEERLAEAAAGRRRTPGARVLFYGRRTKHRNLFGLGVSAIGYAAERLRADLGRVEFCSLGERHGDIALPGGAALRGIGRLEWEEYFRFLSGVDVALSLQQSPHPSHPPFDAAISGGHAITNDFDGTRGSLHPRIAAVPADTRSLGEALASAVREALDAEPGGYLPVEPGSLGSPLDDVLAAAAQRLA